MVGYRSTPALDEHYGGVTLPILTRLRDKAGFHPSARINGVRAADLSVITLLLTSARLKHIQFVASGKRLWPEVNFWMSLSVWKPKDEIVEMLSGATGMDEHLVSTIIDMLTLTADSEADFTSDVDPVIPFFIKFTDSYLIEPAFALFINPFDTVKRIQNQPQTHTSLRLPRENWMRTDLNALFQGTRYYRLETPAKLEIFLFYSIDLEPSFNRDVRNIGHFGTGDLEIIITDAATLEMAKPLTERSYDGA